MEGWNSRRGDSKLRKTSYIDTNYKFPSIKMIVLVSNRTVSSDMICQYCNGSLSSYISTRPDFAAFTSFLHCFWYKNWQASVSFCRASLFEPPNTIESFKPPRTRNGQFGGRNWFFSRQTSPVTSFSKSAW